MFLHNWLFVVLFFSDFVVQSAVVTFVRFVLYTCVFDYLLL